MLHRGVAATKRGWSGPCVKVASGLFLKDMDMRPIFSRRALAMVRPGCGCRSGLVFVTLSVAMRLGYQIIVDIDAYRRPGHGSSLAWRRDRRSSREDRGHALVQGCSHCELGTKEAVVAEHIAPMIATGPSGPGGGPALPPWLDDLSIQMTRTRPWWTSGSRPS